MKAIIFCRVSSREQEETGYSLDSQEKYLKEYSDSKGFVIVNVFKISESASEKQSRKIFQEIFKYILKNRIDTICCEKTDRLTRNPRDALQVNDWLNEDAARNVHFVKENIVVNKNTPAHEKFVWDMKVAIARYYTNNLSEEVRKGQKEKLAQGWLPSKSPIGYVASGEKGHKIHVIDKNKAIHIKRMFELYATGNYSVKALADLLYKEGFRNQSGKKVSKSLIYMYLTHPFYCGKLKWKNQIYAGKQEPIVSTQLFNQVQQKLDRGLKIPLYRKHLPVFKAKIDCAGCSGYFTWERQKGNWYGHCNHYRPCENNKWWRQEKVEEQILPYFWLAAPESQQVVEIIKESSKYVNSNSESQNTNSQKQLEKIIATLKRRLEAIYDDKVDGIISKDFYDKKHAQYTQELSEAETELAKLSGDKSKYFEAAVALHDLAFWADDIFEGPEITVEDKRLLLGIIFSNLVLNAENIRTEYTLSFQFVAEWVPKVNDSFELYKTIGNKGDIRDFIYFSPVMRAFQDGFRTFDWPSAIEDVDTFMKEVKHLLSLVQNKPKGSIS